MWSKTQIVYHFQACLTLFKSKTGLFCFFLMMIGGQAQLFSQETSSIQSNQQIIDQLVAECRPAVDDTAFFFQNNDTPAWVLSTILPFWQQAGKHVFITDQVIADSSTSGDLNPPKNQQLNTLSVTYFESQIIYRELRKKQFSRLIRVDLNAQVLSPQNELISATPCFRTVNDTLSQAAKNLIQNPNEPQTVGIWDTSYTPAKYVEPLVLGLAIATIVGLLFTLRSQSE